MYVCSCVFVCVWYVCVYYAVESEYVVVVVVVVLWNVAFVIGLM